MRTHLPTQTPTQDPAAHQEAEDAAPPVQLADCVALLERRREALFRELRNFARPVAACDVDYNTLLMELAEVTQVITRLRAVARGDLHVAHPREDSASERRAH